MQAFDCIEQLLVTICLQDITLTTNWLRTIACKLVLTDICLQKSACGQLLVTLYVLRSYLHIVDRNVLIFL